MSSKRVEGEKRMVSVDKIGSLAEPRLHSDGRPPKSPTMAHGTAESVGLPVGAGPIVSVSNLSKTYKGGFQALKTVDLEIRRG